MNNNVCTKAQKGRLERQDLRTTNPYGMNKRTRKNVNGKINLLGEYSLQFSD